MCACLCARVRMHACVRACVLVGGLIDYCLSFQRHKRDKLGNFSHFSDMLFFLSKT